MSESEKITLIDVATANFKTGVTEGTTVTNLLELAGVDLSDSTEITIRVNGEEVGMDHVLSAGDVVLMTRNIEGGA